MIPGVAECRLGFDVTRRLLLGDGGGVAQLDTSFEGFWRSFLVLVPLIPCIAVIFLAKDLLLRDEGRILVGSTGFYVAQSLALLVQWFGFPVIMAVVTRLLKVESAFVTFVVAYNWSAIFVLPIYTIPGVLFVIGVLGTPLFGLFAFALLIVGLRIAYVIAQKTLGIDALTATGIVALGFIFDYAVQIAADSMIGISV